jgi:hypothetical protein
MPDDIDGVKDSMVDITRADPFSAPFFPSGLHLFKNLAVWFIGEMEIEMGKRNQFG